MFHRKCIIFLVFLILLGSTAFGFDFFMTSTSVDMMMFYREEMAEHLKMLNNGEEYIFYSSAYINGLFENYNFDFDNDDFDADSMSSVSNLTYTMFFRLSNNFLIPLNVSLNFLGGLYGDWKDAGTFYSMCLKIFPNSGLIFQNRFGTIGLLAGYSFNLYTEEGVISRNKDVVVDSRIEEEDFHYSIIAIFNTADIPVIGKVFNQLTGSYGFSHKGMLSSFGIGSDSVSGSYSSGNNDFNISFKFSIKPFEIGSVSVTRLEPYFSRKPYNLFVNKMEFGLFSNVNINNVFLFFLDIGYNHYYNKKYDSYLYEDTPFFRFGIPLYLPWEKEDNFTGISIYMDKAFIMPKIGIFGPIGKGMMIMEIGFYKSFNIFVTYRLMI
ncbi:MAG: hypothetical protein LBU88_08695 [Treponema sp.]|jgi:hypothetical protein|nr:hypothetical protein [Treponema sp.]